MQYLYLCAWCKPLDRLKGSHGICERHYREIMAGIAKGAK